MYSTSSSPKGNGRNIKRANSDNSLRRSVSVMKSLLPLKLSSSPLPSCSSPKPIEQFTFGFEQQLGDDPTLREPWQSLKRRLKAPRPMTIRREQYRDTPVYTEPGSPLLNLAYYTDEEVCLNSSTVDFGDETSVIHGYTSSSSKNGDGDFEDLDGDTPLPEGISQTRRNRLARSSDLSFNCLEESGVPSKPLFCNEGAWLSSPLNRWDSPNVDALPQLLAESMSVEHDMEGWLSDASSICGEDSYVQATALTPTRATVIEVNPHRLPIKIPPRSSSLIRTRPQSFGLNEERHMQMPFRNNHGRLGVEPYDHWVEDSHPTTKPWLSLPISNNNSNPSLPSPPLSPIELNSTRGRAEMNWRSNPVPRTYHEIMPWQASRRNSISQIISALDESTSDFPPSILNIETPVISMIRTHFHQTSSSYSQWDVPVPLPSPFSEGVDWRPRPNPPTPRRRPKTSYFSSLQRTFSSRTSRTVPISKQDWDQTQDLPIHPHPPSDPHPKQPNLGPLNIIFPTITHHVLSILYAHILAYLFVTSLPGHYSFPSTYTPPHSPTYLPYYNTTSQPIPQKAAERLGISPSTGNLSKVNITDDAIILRQSGMGTGMLEEKLRGAIGWLIAGMSDNEREAGEGRVNAPFLRALGEIVKGCERDCSEWI